MASAARTAFCREVSTILNDNSIQFADRPRKRTLWTTRLRVQRFDQICREHGIQHRLTKPNHPRTNGQRQFYFSRNFAERPYVAGRPVKRNWASRKVVTVVV